MPKIRLTGLSDKSLQECTVEEDKETGNLFLKSNFPSIIARTQLESCRQEANEQLQEILKQIKVALEDRKETWFENDKGETYWVHVVKFTLRQWQSLCKLIGG